MEAIKSKKEVLFNNTSLTIEYDSQNNFLYANWKGYQTEESIKSGCGKMLQFLKEKRCTKVLNDNTLVKGTWSSSATWGASVWFPQMASAGLKYFAWVYSPDVFGKFSTDATLKQMNDKDSKDWIGFNGRTFKSIEEAARWLIGVN